jgi:outer membrane immunogenic protein
MKKYLLATVAVLFAVTSAQATDLGVRGPINKAPESLPYGDPWTGFYAGGAVGYGWDRGEGTGSATTRFGAGEAPFATSPQGVVGGLHLGLGTRFGGNWYLGGEVAGGIGSIDGTPQDPGLFLKVNSKTHWLGSVSGRLGYIIVPNVMVYGRGGWAWAGAEFTAADAFGGIVSTKPVLSGPMAGAGVEAALTHNWIVGVEYQHYFLGDINKTAAGSITNGEVTLPAVFTARVSNNIDTVLARLSYHF